MSPRMETSQSKQPVPDLLSRPKTVLCLNWSSSISVLVHDLCHVRKHQWEESGSIFITCSSSSIWSFSLLGSCWPISPPYWSPPQSFTTPRFQLFAKLSVSSSKLLMKTLNNTGSCTNLWSTLDSDWLLRQLLNSLCWCWRLGGGLFSYSFLLCGGFFPLWC